MKATPPITRVMLYVKDIPKVAAFYTTHFGFRALPQRQTDLLEVTSTSGQFSLLLHQASKGHRVGQSCIKLVFDVEDIDGFKAEAEKEGLVFGETYKGEGYEFANARDPAENPIQISRRAFLR
jgi:predicted enzyme related to lactoylglutathione lyase